MFRMFITVAILSVAFNHANGGIIVAVQNATMTAGASSYVDVYITGAPGDELGRFGYEFSISSATPQSGDLQFSPVQSNSEQIIGSSPPDHLGYVFLGDTDPGNWNSNLGGNAVTLRGGDVLNLGNSVSIDGPYLLARLELLHTGPMSVASHAFTISLNPLSPFTEFDKDFDPGTDTNYSAGQITALSGTVTVNGAAAVPEPASFLMLAIGGGSWLLVRRRRCFCFER